MLGFHMFAHMPNDVPTEPNQKQLLYCAVYWFDKTLCLRLGHSSSIPDYDVPLLWLGTDNSTSFALQVFCHSVRVASLIGRIYEQLYSASALRLPVDIRAQRVNDLAHELVEYQVEAQELAVSFLCPFVY